MSKQKRRRPAEPESVRDGRTKERRNSVLEKSPLDFVSYKVLSYAFKNGFTPPFRLQLFESGKDAVIQETRVTVRDSEVLEEVVSAREGAVCCPLECKLVDRDGRTHNATFTDEEMRKVFETIVQMETDGMEYTFHGTGVIPVIQVSAESSEFSGEVYATVVGMLIAAGRIGFNLPFQIEVRDAHGQLQGRTEVDFSTNAEFRETAFANCDRGVFPMTVKLTDGDGREFTETVERRT